MEDLRGVNIFETAQNLVNKVLLVLSGERLFGANNLVEIRIHQFIHDVAAERVSLSNGHRGD